MCVCVFVCNYYYQAVVLSLLLLLYLFADSDKKCDMRWSWIGNFYVSVEGYRSFVVDSVDMCLYECMRDMNSEPKCLFLTLDKDLMICKLYSTRIGIDYIQKEWNYIEVVNCRYYIVQPYCAGE